MKNTIYIITGANGFLGNNVIRALRTREPDAEIRALILNGSDGEMLKGLDCKIFEGDVTNKESLKGIFSVQPDAQLCVIHCAALVYIKSKYNPKVFEVNLGGTKNIAELSLEKNAKLVYVSSVHAITEKPNNGLITEIRDFNSDSVVGLYAKSKAETAKYVLEMVEKHGLNACIVHPSGIIGPNDYSGTHLTQLIIDYAKGRLTACVHGGYDFVDVRDVAEGILSACTLGKPGECYILSNKYIEVKELLDLCAATLHKKIIRTILPMWFVKLTAPFSELYYSILRQPPLYTRYSLYTLNSNANFSNEKAKRELNYKTRDIKQTVEDTVSWLKSSGKIK